MQRKILGCINVIMEALFGTKAFNLYICYHKYKRMLYRISEWIDAHAGTCIYKGYLGIQCPGCGMQRSFSALLRGEIKESFMLFPALIPLMFTLILLVWHLRFPLKYGAKILLSLYIANAIIIAIHYIIQLI